MHEFLKTSLSKRKEKELTNSVVVPLLEVLHPGRVEYTHSAIESGRDLVSFGKDMLGRPHILCVQVKASRISYAAKNFGQLFSIASVARDAGVTVQDGNTILPHEVWIISSKSFAEQERRQVDSILKKMTQNNIKIIALDELCGLLIEHLPRLAARLSQYVDTKAADLITLFSRHRESRAFGLSYDRPLQEFYVPVTFAPRVDLAYAALNDKITVRDRVERYRIRLCELVGPKEIHDDISNIQEKLLTRLHKNISLSSRERDSVKFKVTLSDDWQLIFGQYRDDIDDAAKTTPTGNDEKRRTEDEKRLQKYHISYYTTLYLQQALKEEVRKAKKEISQCSKTLRKNQKNLPRLYAAINKLNEFMLSLMNKCEVEVNDYDSYTPDIVRVQVQDPLDVLELSQLVMIEGPPGSGKTTFLRILSIRILEDGGKVLYVPCCSIQPKDRSKSLSSIVRNSSQGGVARKWTFKDSILVLDGLDEAPFDLTDKIIKGSHRFHKIIVSARTAFKTGVRDRSFNVALALFDKAERNEFFQKWFSGDKSCIKTVKMLISNSPDIDYHTRLPLIATITASLIQRGYAPTTRSEIYDCRLRLLLSQWDRIREIERFLIDDPNAKRRFLRRLAYNVHSSAERRRTFNFEDIRKAFTEALGDWGYRHGIRGIMNDLIVASGVIIEERRNVYSFGHLSFQEHLVGEYMIEQHFPPDRLKALMVNDWWREPFLFYASIKGDITDLVEHLSCDAEIFLYVGLLVEMVRYAPYTSAGAGEMLLNLSKLVKEREK
jgi:hypothetical protein